jgi:hypothetical protein
MVAQKQDELLPDRSGCSEDGYVDLLHLHTSISVCWIEISWRGFR